MVIKLLPEHEQIVGTTTVKKPAVTGRIKIRPEDQAVLDGKMPPAPAPTPAPVEVPQPSLLQKIKSTVSKGTDFVVDQAQQAYERGKIKEPQFKASVGEGMTPEQEMLAQESIKVGNQADPILDAYADIKLPFIDAGITYNKNKQLPLVTDVVKSLVEAPEKAVRTATEVAGLTKFTDERGGDPMFQTASYGEKATRLADDFLNKGYSYSASVLLGAGLTGFEASGDFLFYSSLLKAGGAKAAGQAAGKITPDEVRTAHEFLGNPKSLAEAEARWRELQKQFHPDKNGGNDTISKQLNNAIAILRREGIPDARYAGIVDNRPTKKVEVKRIGEAPVEVPPPVQAVVPEPTPAPVVRTTPEVPTIAKEKTDTINIVPENIVETSKKEGLDYNPMTQVKMSDGEIVKRPETIVSRTQLQGLIKTLEKDEITLTIDDSKNLVYSEPGKREIVIKAKALGLVTDRLPVGGKVKITRAALGVKGTAKDTVFRGVDDDGQVVAKEYTQPENTTAAKTPEELKQRIEQLNKVAQSQAILRKAGGAGKGNAGVFKRGDNLPKQGQVNLKKDVLLNDRAYMETLAHELGHALENKLTGSVNTMTHKVFGDAVTKEEWKTIRKELEAVTRDLVGDAEVNLKPGYYLKNTELLARFIEKQFASPGNLNDIAPTAMEFFQKNAIKNPIIQDYLDAVAGTIDEGSLKWIMIRDMKQTYQKYLGKKLGTMAWNDEVVLRGMVERAKIEVEKLLDTKFKNVKDDPTLLFRAVESIKVTKNGTPEFGTRKFLYVDDLSEAKALEDEGWKVLRDKNGDHVMEIVQGKSKIRIVQDRYTPEQGRAFFDELTPEGKQLVKDFTSARAEAKDYFNRELIKDKHKIEGNVEGWVHHLWPETKDLPGPSSNKFRLKTAASRKMRTEQEGYIEDLRVAMEKMMKEVNIEEAYNEHIGGFLARVTKPYTKGMPIDHGWIVVEGDLKTGVSRVGQNRFTAIKEDGETVNIKKPQYLMPDKVYRRYELVTQVAEEMSNMIKAFNTMNRYWKVNILFHLGSTATNLFSGALQYSSKIMIDFYEELLTGKVALPQTRANIESILTTVLPKGWSDAPDWVYGGDMSNNYGQFSLEKTPGGGLSNYAKQRFGEGSKTQKNIEAVETFVDKYGDTVLKTYGLVERYWKKVVMSSEGGSKLNKLKMGGGGLKSLAEEEREIIARINEKTDFYAYDYDNVPVQLDEWSRSPLGSAITPFLKYPYKNIKQITGMVENVFDRTLPYEKRLSGILFLGTLVSIYAYLREQKREEQKTPQVPASAPASMSTRGRLFVGTDEDGNELFTRVAKYPFVNLTEAGIQYLEGNGKQSWESIQDMLGSFGPFAEGSLALLGWSTKYNENVPLSARMGKLTASFMPGTRILSGAANYQDPYKRTQQNFLQGIGTVLPLPYDEETFSKLRGKIKTVPVPIEGSIEDTNEFGSRRTTVDKPMLNYKEDILMGEILGILINRINPEWADAFVERKQKNDEKKQAKEE